MSKVPSLSYTEIIRALQRDSWTVIRQRGSHIRLQKQIGNELAKCDSDNILKDVRKAVKGTEAV